MSLGTNCRCLKISIYTIVFSCGELTVIGSRHIDAVLLWISYLLHMTCGDVHSNKIASPIPCDTDRKNVQVHGTVTEVVTDIS